MRTSLLIPHSRTTFARSTGRVTLASLFARPPTRATMQRRARAMSRLSCSPSLRLPLTRLSCSHHGTSRRWSSSAGCSGGNEPVVLRDAIPLVLLLKAVDMVTSGGGTMLREATYLGVPPLAFFRETLVRSMRIGCRSAGCTS